MKEGTQNLFSNTIQSVSVRTLLDPRRSDERVPITTIVTCRKTRQYLKTGIRATREEYAEILKARTSGASQFSKDKAEAERFHLRVVDAVRNIYTEYDTFSFSQLDVELSRRPANDKTFVEEYLRYATGIPLRTWITKNTSLKSFMRFMGADCDSRKNEDGRPEIVILPTTPRKVAELTPSDITTDLIISWQKSLRDEGKSNTTIKIYSQDIKAALNRMETDGIIKKAPKITIPPVNRRRSNFLTVEQILRLRDYKGVSERWRDFWLMLYFCNGCNPRDFITLKWEESYFQNNELQFVRSKTSNKTPTIIYIPVIEPLKELLDKYATKPKLGEYLFPDHLGDAKTEDEIATKATNLILAMNQGLERISRDLGFRKISTSWARNSYITTLTWHGISDAFIDDMTGHVGTNPILRGYQGFISPKKRYKINSLLLTPPDED